MLQLFQEFHWSSLEFNKTIFCNFILIIIFSTNFRHKKVLHLHNHTENFHFIRAPSYSQVNKGLTNDSSSKTVSSSNKQFFVNTNLKMKNNEPGFNPILGERIFEKNVLKIISSKGLKLLTIFFSFCSREENDSFFVDPCSKEEWK